MKKLFVVVLLAGLILPLLFTGTAFASGFYDDKIIFGDNFTLASGQTIDGNLIVMGGNVTIEDGATVTDSVVVFGGNVDIAGNVKVDVVVIGGNVDLQGTAIVDGRLVSTGGSVSRGEGAVISGGESSDFEPGQYFYPPAPFRPFRPNVTVYGFDPIAAMVWQGIETVGWALGMSLIALLVAAVWPTQTNRVTATVTATPALSGGLGLLTLIVGPVVMVLTAITVCLIPATLVVALLYGMAIVFGWIALGAIVGARLTIALNLRSVSPALATAFGTFLLSLAMGVVGYVACLGAIVEIIFAAIGLGAVILTRFGTRPYLRRGEPTPAQPATSMPPAPPSVSGPDSNAAATTVVQTEVKPPSTEAPLTT